MKGKIDKSGALYIERNGKMIPMLCPLIVDGTCCHYCPLFGEPTGRGVMEFEMLFNKKSDAENAIKGIVVTDATITPMRPSMMSDKMYSLKYSIFSPIKLQICQNRVLEFDEFVDEREGVNHD